MEDGARLRMGMQNHAARPFAALLVFIACATPGIVAAHIEQDEPTPRPNSAPNQITPPCGGLPRSATPLSMQAGSQLRLRWHETIDHPGSYRISFGRSTGPTFNGNQLGDMVLDNAVMGTYSATVTLPSTPCTDCTLQLIQISSNQAPPAGQVTPSGFREYAFCTDMVLTAAAPAGTEGTTGTTGTTGGGTTGGVAKATTGSQTTGGSKARVSNEDDNDPDNASVGGCTQAGGVAPLAALAAAAVLLYRRRVQRSGGDH
jgi:hypothetical protein